MTYRLSEHLFKNSLDFQGLNNVLGVLGKHYCVFLDSHTQNTSDTKCVGFFPTLTNVPTIVVYPTTQFSADTVYLDLVSDSTTERLDQSHQAPPISDAKGKFQVVTCTSDWSALNQVPMIPSSSLIIS